jgi:hypothetical protein
MNRENHPEANLKHQKPSSHGESPRMFLLASVKIPPVVSQVEPPLKIWRNDGGKIHHTDESPALTRNECKSRGSIE